MVYSKNVKAYFLLSLIISILFVKIVFTNSIGYNLLTNNSKWNREIQFLFPQGWAFFTKDPREEQTRFYKLSKNDLQELDFKNGSINSSFGISRKNRIMLIETAQIVNQIDNSLWVDLKSKEDLETYKDTTKSLEIINFVNKAEIENGDYVILKQRPVPWSWRENKDNLFMPAKAIKIKLKKL
jgi:antimicrobial peptide system SdpA family protein